MYTTYILYSINLDKFYIGYTSGDIHVRLSKHLSNHKGYTAKAKDWKIVYTEKIENKHDAMKRELQLKS